MDDTFRFETKYFDMKSVLFLVSQCETNLFVIPQAIITVYKEIIIICGACAQITCYSF